MESTALQVVTFQDTDIKIIDHGGHNWVLAKEVGLALGYADHRAFYKLLDRHPRDFEGKTAMITGVVNLTTEEIRIVSYHGIIRAAMLAKTDRAIAFRDWAETVLFEVMITGRYDVREHLLTTQEACHKDINILRDLVAADPTQASWAFKSMHNRWVRYELTQMVPRPYITELTSEWFKQTYGAEQWSKDAVIDIWPEVAKAKDFELYRKSCNVPKHNAFPIDPAMAFVFYRDKHQFKMTVDSIIRKHKLYSRDGIQKALREVDKYIIDGMKNNEKYNVERYSEQKYREHLKNSPEWDNKKHIMLFPTGPFNLCWECLRPISLATGILHHITYDRLGHELWADFEPVCPMCHAYLHSDKTGLPAENPNGVVTIANVTVTKQNDSGKSMLCRIRDEIKVVPHFAIQGASEITKHAQPGDSGTLIMMARIARDNGIT